MGYRFEKTRLCWIGREPRDLGAGILMAGSNGCTRSRAAKVGVLVLLLAFLPSGLSDVRGDGPPPEKDVPSATDDRHESPKPAVSQPDSNEEPVLAPKPFPAQSSGKLTSTPIQRHLTKSALNRRPPRPAAQGRVPAKVLRYSGRLLKRYDSDGNGQLDRSEWSTAPQALHGADADGNGIITRDELAYLIADYGKRRRFRLASPGAEVTSPSQIGLPRGSEFSRKQSNDGTGTSSATGPNGGPQAPKLQRRDSKFFVRGDQLPGGLPEWFASRDRNGDGQLSLAEFTPKGMRSEAARFAALDTNSDGVVTARECVRSGESAGTGKTAAGSPAP
jgi:hypothetical protein